MIFLVSYWWAVLIGFLLYWLPTFVARSRRVSSWVSIAWLNFLFGWTVLGWFAALAWASTAQRMTRGRQRHSPSTFEKPDQWEPLSRND
jgi:hypothetical protein